ncbi:MAG: nucleotidyl transferase AbiEii/AbiGii toxin family protein [bacterium]
MEVKKMKDRAIEIGSEADTDLQGYSQMREYLQHIILRELFELDVLEDIVFHGGTALHFIYDLNRYSEDLDFHTQKINRDWKLQPVLKKLQKNLQLQGYSFAFTEPSAKNVKSSFLKFEDILYESGISNHKSEKLNIKIEIDINPPAGFQTKSSSINQFFPYIVHHHDLPSFFAGKLHAILQRAWTKGRDYYDLWFYITRLSSLKPNFNYLHNALTQTGYEGEKITPNNWKKLTAQRVKEAQWDKVQDDVAPFLTHPADLKAFRKEMLLKELEPQKN